MALIKSVKDDEERKRRQQAQANQTAQNAANKSAQMNSDAAKRNSAGVNKAPTQSAADVIKAAKEKAKTGTVTKTPKQYANSAQYVKKSNPVRQTFNYETLGTQERVDQVASWIVDPKEKQGFLDGWNAYTNTKSYKNKQKRKEQLQGLSGLYDADGRPININTASYNQVVQGVRSIADATKRKEAASKLEEMTKTWGSRFYGQTYTKDIVTSYLGNPEFDEQTYKDEIEQYENAFYAQSGYSEQNNEAYLGFYEDIAASGYSQHVQRQLVEALDAAYQNSTGKAAPDVRALVAAKNAPESATEEAEEEQGGGIIDTVKGWFGGDKATPEEVAEDAPKEEGKGFWQNASEVIGDVVSGEIYMDDEWVEQWKKEHNGEMPKISDLPGYKGMSASATVSDVKQGSVPKYMSVKDDADILRLFKAGRLDEVDPKKSEAFREMISNPYAKQMLGTIADDKQYAQVMAGNVGAEMAGLKNLTSLGNTFYDAYAMINGDAFPDELRDDGMLVLLELTSRASDMERRGMLGGDPYLPVMERYMQTSEYAKGQLNELYSARDELIRNKEELLAEQQQASDKAIAEAREAFAMGEASDEQIALVYQSVPEDVGRKAYKDKTYKEMNKYVKYWDYGYFDEDGGEFNNTALYANMPKDDPIAYKCALSSQMQEVLKQDARAAYSLGMNLEEFYAKMGGMSYDTIANRASEKMVSEAKSITPEDAQAIDAVTTGDGQGIGWVATGGLATSNAVLSTYEAYADTLYMGLTEGNAIRAGEKMKAKYEQEFGVIEGRRMYRDELQDYINSGLLDESYAKALQSALDNTNDVYSLGIDPADAEGFIVKSGAWARRNAEMSAAYVYDNATDAEREAFNLLSSTLQNGIQMGVSYLGTAAAGAALGGIPTATAKGAKRIQKIAQHFGFAVGYDAGQWSQNVEARMDEGYSRDAAVWLGSADTLGNHAANYMTYGNILTRATGLNTLADNAMGWMFSNPIGALKGMAAVKAFASGAITGAQNVAEEIGDTFKETMVQSGIDKWVAPLFKRMDAGEDIGAADVLRAMLSAVSPEEVADYAAGAAKEAIATAPETAIQTSLFAIAGAAGNAYNTYKGYRTAQSMPIYADGIAAFESVQKAVDIVNGRDNDVQGFLDAFKADLEDDKFIRLFNEAAETQGLAYRTMNNFIRATGNEEKIKMITAKSEQVKSHQAKAEANTAAINKAVESMTVAQEKIDNGIGDDTDVQVVIDSAEAIAKNKTGLDEANREIAQKTREIQDLQGEMMQEARADAERQVKAENARAMEYAAEQVAQQTQQAEVDNVTALEADNFVNERYPNATPEQRQRLLDQYNAVVRGRIDTEFKSVDMAVRQFKKKFKNINFTVVDSLAGSEGGYVRDRNTVYIARDMTYGEIANRVITHELTHASEAGGKAYEQLRDALINLRYKGDQEQLRADILSKQNQYNDHFTQNNIMDDATGEAKKLSEEEAMQEIVAQINSEILSGNEEMINRLVADQPSVARRIWETVKDFLQKVGVIKDTEIDQLRRVEKMFEKALNQAQTKQRDFGSDGIQYSIREKQPPKNVVYAYKAFYARDGKLYPPMVANITDESDKQKVKGATSGTMKSLPTPVGVWLDADVGGIMTDENGEPVRAKDTKRLRVKNDKSGGSATLAFRPGWHLGEWPDAKQFNKADPETGERGKRMPDDLVFAKCEVSADIDYQLDALSYGINEKGGFSRSQAGLPEIPEDGYYKYRTNVDPTTAPWMIAGSIKVTEILDDDDCARICAEFGVTPDKRVSGEKIDLAKYGLKRGPVEETTEGMEKFRENDANRANKALLERALSDPNYTNAYVKRDIDFDNPAQYEQLKKEFSMNGQDIEQYKKLYETRGFASERRAQPIAENKSTGEPLVGEVKGSAMQFSLPGDKNPEIAHIKDQIRSNQDKLNSMEAVADVKAPDVGKLNTKKRKEWVLEQLASTGYRVERQGFGAIEFGENQINKSLEYLDDPEEVAAFLALPRVLKRGIEIGEHTDHKSRGFSTVTIAAPIKINGVPGNMGAVVKRLGRNLYKTHRVLMPDGTAFTYEIEKAEPKPTNGAATSGPHDSRISSANPSIAQGGADYKNKMQRSLPSDDSLVSEMQAYHALQNQPEPEQAQQIPNQEQQPKRMGERQFTTKTLQESPAVPQWLKNELYSNPEARFYEKDTNNDQIVRSWERLQKEGYEAMRDRVLNSDAQNPDNVADANMILAMANREGDTKTFLDVALHYAKEGTQTAKTLQARKVFSRMTPTGMKVWASGQAESNLAKYIDEHRPIKRKVDRAAKKVAEKIKDLQGGDELLRLQAAGEYTITSEDARWGVPINEKQRALIKEYGLEKVARPGINYNRATMKQRMLEAILVEPNPENVTGNGLNLIQRLEYMREDAAVITNADLDYMGSQMTLFAHSPVDDQEGRVGDIALARLYEAYGNITPATMAEKAKTWRYTSMLLSFQSATRNVIGNAAQNAVNATAHSVATVLDWGVSKATGERTVAGLTFKERADGWAAFRDETVNTFRDFYTDKAITSHGEDRHNLNQRGRVYQNGTLEMLRLTEGFLMSVGDRNFWKKAYVNSLAEQQRVADLNGEAFDYEVACERAEAEANYATFNEDSRVRDLLTQLKHPPEDASFKDKALAMAIDFLMPFTSVPTNITKRMIDYSPAGLAFTALEHGVKAVQGKNFDQNAFVNGMARGLTGTALLAIGMELFKAGLVSLGTGEEEDKRIYGAETAQGRQYTPYIRVGDQYVALSTFMPAASAIIMGATAQKVFENDENALNAIKSACFASIDMIFDASYMSPLADIFGGYGTLGENAVDSLINSTISQNVPAVFGQIASSMDPYVRDTKDKNAVMQALKSGLISKIPGLRQQLEAKVDITGEKVKNSKYGVALVDPFTRSYANDDPALQELIDFARESGDTGVIPELFVKSNKYEVAITKTQAKALKVNRGKGANGKIDYQALTLDVTDEEKWDLNEKYGKLVFGELRKLLESRKWKRAEEAERIKLAEEIIKDAKLDILEDFLKERDVK